MLPSGVKPREDELRVEATASTGLFIVQIADVTVVPGNQDTYDFFAPSEFPLDEQSDEDDQLQLFDTDDNSPPS